MNNPSIVILGAGGAGAAAAHVLAAAGVEHTVVTATGQAPFNRTLVNKGVAIGLIAAEQTHTPGLRTIQDTASHVDTKRQRVALASGRTLPYTHLLVATGSRPRHLAPAIPGVPDAANAGRLTTLHSLTDAERIRDRLAALGRVGRVAIFGAGLVGAETASLLADRGHDITLITRSTTPAARTFGHRIDARLTDLHRARTSLLLGRLPVAVRHTTDAITIDLDDGGTVTADLAIVAHGTRPSGPAPWADGIHVNDRLRAAADGVYGAGGVAIHNDDRIGRWRIDHWTDAVAQGQHAARTLLHDLGAGDGQGSYLPRSLFTAAVHGVALAGAGLPGEGAAERDLSHDPLLMAFDRDTAMTGLAGIDAITDLVAAATCLAEPART